MARASSPVLKIVSPGLKRTILMLLERACICLLVRQENSGTFCMVYRFLDCYSSFIFFKVFLQIDGFMIRNQQFLPEGQSMEAVLGQLKRSANSPKVSPLVIFLTNLPLISTSTVPFKMRKKQHPMSPCLKMYFSYNLFLAYIIYSAMVLSYLLLSTPKS